MHYMQTQLQQMSHLTSPLFPIAIAINLIQEFVRSINPLTIERQRTKWRQTETGKIPGDCDRLSHGHSKLLPDFPPILNIMSLAIDIGEQNTIPHRILASYWLLHLKIFELMADKGSL
jgi:hypothetical protein